MQSAKKAIAVVLKVLSLYPTSHFTALTAREQLFLNVQSFISMYLIGKLYIWCSQCVWIQKILKWTDSSIFCKKKNPHFVQEYSTIQLCKIIKYRHCTNISPKGKHSVKQTFQCIGLLEGSVTRDLSFNTCKTRPKG